MHDFNRCSFLHSSILNLIKLKLETHHLFKRMKHAGPCKDFRLVNCQLKLQAMGEGLELKTWGAALLGKAYCM